MNGEPLSDDLEDWPRDPWKLLGIGRRATRKDLRRAYAALIRRYKPEHHPEQFRLIREAFDILDDIVSQRDSPESASASEAPSFQDQPPSADESDIEPGADAVRNSFSPIDAPLHGPLGDAEPPHQEGSESSAEVLDLERRWIAALRRGGDWLAFYGELAVQAEHGTTHPACFCRLYALLKVAPQVDPARTPQDWLSLGLSRTSHAPQLVDLYLEELKRRPEEVLKERSRALICQQWPAQQKYELTRGRWLALRELCRIDEIAADLKSPQLLPLDPGERLPLFLCAAEILIWDNNSHQDPALKSVLREIDDLSDVRARHSWELDRHDLLQVIAAEYHKCRRTWAEFSGATTHLVELIPDLWLCLPGHEQRLIETVAGWVEHPVAALDRLDSANQNLRATVYFLTMQLQDLGDTARPPLEGKRLQAVETLITKKIGLNYARCRAGIVNECLRLGITVREILAVMSDSPQFHSWDAGPAIIEALQGDMPLRCLLAGLQAFWVN